MILTCLVKQVPHSLDQLFFLLDLTLSDDRSLLDEVDPVCPELVAHIFELFMNAEQLLIIVIHDRLPVNVLVFGLLLFAESRSRFLCFVLV